MGATTATGLMTVAEFQKLRDPAGSYYELRDGEAILVTRSKFDHVSMQQQLALLLQRVADSPRLIFIELPYKPTGEHQLWVADVAFLSRERRTIGEDGVLEGSPELVVEILSPSNTALEMDRKSALCLASGGIEFWIVNPGSKTVTVWTAATRATYSVDDSIPLDRLFPGKAGIRVAAIFEQI